jgi:GTPase SAR1 family protein
MQHNGHKNHQVTQHAPHPLPEIWDQPRGASAVRAELAAMSPDADFGGEREVYRDYLEELRVQYRTLENTNALARNVVPPSLPLREIFVPQWVRAQPPQTELPREVRQRLIDNGRLSKRDMPEGVDSGQLEREFKAYAGSPQRPVLEVISEPERRRLVVLGDPGAGKSTLAAYLTLVISDMAVHGGGSADSHPLAGLAGYLPILLELRTYAEHAEREDFLGEIDRLHRTGLLGLPRRELEAYLKQGKPALVIFDGLDEVFDKKQRKSIKRKIHTFARRYPGVRVIVTSRATDYEPERQILDGFGFAHFTLQDLDQRQVTDFIQQFYSMAFPNNPTKATALAARLHSAVVDSPAIAELAGNPMLLTTLALLGISKPLSRNRRIALEHTVEVLVEAWDEEKSVEKYLQPGRGASEVELPTTRGKKELLRLVARRIQEARPGAGGLAKNYLSGAALSTIFTESRRPESEDERSRAEKFAKTLVDQLRKRDYILAKFGYDTFGFVHRALLDYFAADDINTQFNRRELGLPDIEKLFRDRSMAPEWQEVLLLLAEMLPPEFAEKAIFALLGSNSRWYQSGDPMPRHVLLAIRCLGEIQPEHKMRSAGRAAVDALIAMLETLSEPADYPLAVAFMATLERDLLPVLAGLGQDWPGRPVYETWYLARGQFLRGDAPGFAAIAAAKVYVALLGRDDQARDRLRTLARWADSVLVRGAALEALARSWHDEPETAELLGASAADDPDTYVRREAVRALAAHLPGDPATPDLLHERITSDHAAEVQGTALRWLARLGRKEETTASLLRAVGADPEAHGVVRAAAVAELAAGWHSEQTRQWLWDRTDDEDARVRAAAAEALTAGWHDPETHLWLRSHTASAVEHHPQVRAAAVRALAAGWSEERPDTVTLLQGKARIGGDDDPVVRQAAVEALAVGWRETAKTERWLRDQAVTEPDDDVRCTITQALATYWPDDTATADLLEKLARDKDEDWYVHAIAIRALADIRADKPETAEWLRERAKGETPYVRQVALSAAAAGWPEDPETVPWLRERAEDNKEDLDVRAAAVRALAAGWPNEQTLELLIAVGTGNARTGMMRRVAVRSVAARWPDDKRTRPWLRRLATYDKSLAVRQTALQMLAAGTRWHDDPDAVALLRARAIRDEFPDVRRAAIRTLSAGWRGDPGMGDWLRGDAFDGNERPGKLAVIHTLATDWHDDPQTPGWLRDHAAADPDTEVQRSAAGWLARVSE